jgi:transposase
MSSKSHERRQRAWNAAAVVGVDAGKHKHALVVRARGRQDSHPLTFAVTRTGFEQAVNFILAAVPEADPTAILVGIEFAGNYGFTFAHYLHSRGFQVESVLPRHSKVWKDVMHGQPLKTDEKDALSITDLVSHGHFVSFPFLRQEYAELRYLASARESLVRRCSATINRIRAILQVVFPEFERIFGRFTKKTAQAVLAQYAGPGDLLAAPAAEVLALIKRTGRGCAKEKFSQLVDAARTTLGLPIAQGVLRQELPLLVEQLQLYQRQITHVEAQMKRILLVLPEWSALRTIAGVAPVTAAVFLGAIGDPQAYSSSREVLRVAGLGLIERSSGQKQGAVRLGKRGRPMLRQMAYMLAVRSIRRGTPMRARYEALIERNGGKARKALVALMRYLVKLMYAVARDRREYRAMAESSTKSVLVAHGVDADSIGGE